MRLNGSLDFGRISLLAADSAIIRRRLRGGSQLGEPSSSPFQPAGALKASARSQRDPKTLTAAG